jgi:hypothetical protein
MQIAVNQVHVESDDELRSIIDSVGVPDSRLERAELELKAAFNKSKPAWLDLLKHVVAIANSGGGAIFGVDKNGNKTGLADSLLNDLDAANLSNKLGSYSSVRIATSYREIMHQCLRFGFLQIDPGERLAVFESDGNYQAADGKTGKCFTKGVVYVRVPGSTREAEQADLDVLLERVLRIRTTAFLARIQQVAFLPPEAHLIASRPQSAEGVVLGTDTKITLGARRPRP